MVKIAPSLLSADFADMRAEISHLESAGADYLHFDVMDGCYVPNLTFGPAFIGAMRPCSELPFDVHLMIEHPDDKIKWFADSGADIITVHAEACRHLDRTLAQIRKFGCKAGVSLNPSTPPQVLEYVLDRMDMVLIMTVNPGFGGQKFIRSQLEKIAAVRNMIGRRKIKIEVDGGINAQTAAEAVAAGADILVAGTAVFENSNYRKNINSLRRPSKQSGE